MVNFSDLDQTINDLLKIGYKVIEIQVSEKVARQLLEEAWSTQHTDEMPDNTEYVRKYRWVDITTCIGFSPTGRDIIYTVVKE